MSGRAQVWNVGMPPWGSPFSWLLARGGGWLDLLQRGIGYPQRRDAELLVEGHVLISWPAVWPDYLPGGHSGRLMSAKFQPPPTCPISLSSVVNHSANFSLSSPPAPGESLPGVFGDTLTPRGNILWRVTLWQARLPIAARLIFVCLSTRGVPHTHTH